ncbi:MAG: fused MFS/spermidine synthase [Flavobacteriales bacterium]|nr:fused MFS/spermidine synthase [Flavobacteriales bacterium]
MQKWLFYFLAFWEGVSVMALELLAASYIKPIYGASLMVWTSVLALTLAGLAIGYYLGGLLSKKGSLSIVHTIWVSAGTLLLCIPLFMSHFHTFWIEMDLLLGTLLLAGTILFIPITLLGCVIPIIVGQLSRNITDTGSDTGNLFMFSSIGGIISAIITGFILLPAYGVTTCITIFGLLPISLGLFGLLLNKRFLPLLFLPIIILILVSPGNSIPSENSMQLLFSDEGILGNIKVIEQDYPSRYRGTQKARTLFVNNIEQTSMLVNQPKYSAYDYAYYFPTATSIYPPGSKALLLGLGGGTIVKQFNRLEFDLTICELDERIKETAINYFYISPETNIIVDDARHFCETSKDKFKVICYDMYHSEMPPYHLLTKEAFTTVGELLDDEGLLIINFFGRLNSEKGRAARSIYKTLEAVGYHIKLFVTPNQPDNRNLIFLASKTELDFSAINYQEPMLPKLNSIDTHVLDVTDVDFSDALVLTDDCPIFPLIYEVSARQFKQTQTNYYTRKFIANGISPY